ncbi:hypothetical protein PT974_07674 [Cladobotryum mycophilum]|uniref:Uncharacterized protein n=1 Tax=Cladobotryum mycophilum TaxID=491253 RepID=A0ABR0SR37_9HYPO
MAWLAYNPVSKDDQDNDLEDTVHERRQRASSLFKTVSEWGWVFSTFAFAILSLVLVLDRRNNASATGFDVGSLTDLGIAREAIKTEVRRFTGAIIILSDGSITRKIEGTQYVGPASPNIDAAWDDLLLAREMGLHEDEAGHLKDYTLKNNKGNYIISLHVSHSLHCINMLRRHVDFQYYYGNGSSLPEFYRTHIDHCLDHIRQSIECSSDITPVTWSWSDALQLPTSSTDLPHTCRSHSHLRDWAMKLRVNAHKDGVAGPFTSDKNHHHK